MSEGEAGPGDAGGGGGGGSFWTSLPTILTASALFIGAVVGAIVQLRGDNDGGDETATTTAQTTTSEQDKSYFVAMTRSWGRVYFEGETMFVKASKPAQPMLVLAEGDEPLRDVRMSVRAERISGASDYGVGFVCRYENGGNYYLLSVLSEGRYHIVRYRKGKPVSLTGGIQTSAAIDGDAHDIDVRCVGSDPAILTLNVGGREIATARDVDGIEEGNVGIRVGTSESVVTCSFRDFTLRSL
jgi:hypothetical protein